MFCPSCKDTRLAPTKLEPSLAASGCAECAGTLLDLTAYRLWQERHTHDTTIDAEVAPAPEDSQGALLCSHCERIMTRYRYLAHASHFLDVCAHCDFVWLQANEWEFLKTHALHGDLPRIFTEPWQRRLRAERSRQSLESEWDRRLGNDLHEEVRDIGAWLREHPKRDELLVYLASTDPYTA